MMSKELANAASKPPKYIAVDFDLTLCDSKFPDVGPPKPGAREAMQAFRDMGFKTIVSSCRASSYHWDHYYGDALITPATERPVFQNMVRWLEENEIPYDEVDDGTKGKVGAELYIDDKGIRFMNDWPWIVEWVRWNMNGGQK